MTRPPLEVADILRRCGGTFIEKSRRWLNWQHLRVIRAIQNCRTAALGGHKDRCAQCGHRAISFNSCRNRHCPKCQTNARDQWLAARAAEVLPVPYFHVVFTLPHQLSAIVLQNKRYLYKLLLRISAETLLEVAAHPKNLGAQIGFLSVLHTWGQNLLHHPHVHCVIPAAACRPIVRAGSIHPLVVSFSPRISSARCSGASSRTLSSWPFNKERSASTEI